jgi:hypothetical protein
MLIALTTSEYQSYRIEKYIDEFEKSNQRLALENEELLNQYDYYSSSEYQEKVAKQNFGLINPGEEVIIIPESAMVSDEEVFSEGIDDARVRQFKGLSNPVKWWYFFFRRS